jgi:hypothetical protein
MVNLGKTYAKSPIVANILSIAFTRNYSISLGYRGYVRAEETAFPKCYWFFEAPLCLAFRVVNKFLFKECAGSQWSTPAILAT